MRSSLNAALIRLAIVASLTLVAASCAIVGPTVDTPRDPNAASEPPATSESDPARDAPPREVPSPAPPTDERTPAEDEPTPQPDPRGGTDPSARRWREIASGQQSAVRIPVARAVSHADLWADFWAAITANQPDPPTLPQVDFEHETVVVLILGERTTGGYSVGIAAVVERRLEVEVVVLVSRPPPGAMVTQALTTPYYVAAIPIVARDIVFTGDSLEVGFHGD